MSHTQVSLQRQWIELQRDDTLTLHLAAGRVLQLDGVPETPARQHSARVWLTEEGMTDDVFLQPGDSYRIRGAGRVVLSVWSGGTVQVRLAATALPASLPQPAANSSRSIQSASACATA
ncbi:MAG: DUF2917 domain-containing protein [Thiomonas sp.]|nr:DUF2917 domain-containing protein [Thiomonas sp.]